MQLLIEDKLAQSILDYLQTKPYGEVYQFVQGLVQLPASPFTISNEPDEAKEETKEVRPKETPE